MMVISWFLNVTNILEGLQAGTVTGYTVTAKRTKNKWELRNGLCKHCMLGKSKLPAFPRSSTIKGKDGGRIMKGVVHFGKRKRRIT